VNILNVHICTPNLKPDVLPVDAATALVSVDVAADVSFEFDVDVLLLHAANAIVQTIIKEKIIFMM